MSFLSSGSGCFLLIYCEAGTEVFDSSQDNSLIHRRSTHPSPVNVVLLLLLRKKSSRLWDAKGNFTSSLGHVQILGTKGALLTRAPYASMTPRLLPPPPPSDSCPELQTRTSSDLRTCSQMWVDTANSTPLGPWSPPAPAPASPVAHSTLITGASIPLVPSPKAPESSLLPLPLLSHIRKSYIPNRLFLSALSWFEPPSSGAWISPLAS